MSRQPVFAHALVKKSVHQSVKSYCDKRNINLSDFYTNAALRALPKKKKKNGSN